MKLNDRETKLLTLTVVFVLAISAYVLAERIETRRGVVLRDIGTLRRDIELRDAMIARDAYWHGRLRDLRESLPAYPPQQDVTTDLLNLLENTAGRHGLTLLRRDVERERRDGELYELTINCRWRGNLEALVYFLFDLSRHGVRLGIRQLSIAPRGRGQLEGTMTIDGAYSRRADARIDPAAQDDPPS